MMKNGGCLKRMPKNGWSSLVGQSLSGSSAAVCCIPVDAVADCCMLEECIIKNGGFMLRLL